MLLLDDYRCLSCIVSLRPGNGQPHLPAESGGGASGYAGPQRSRTPHLYRPRGGGGRRHLDLTAVTQDEPVDGLGDGDTNPDTVLQDDSILLRRERFRRQGGSFRNCLTRETSTRICDQVFNGVPGCKSFEDACHLNTGILESRPTTANRWRRNDKFPERNICVALTANHLMHKLPFTENDKASLPRTASIMTSSLDVTPPVYCHHSRALVQVEKNRGLKIHNFQRWPQTWRRAFIFFLKISFDSAYASTGL